MNNFTKYLFSLGLGFLGGVTTVATVPGQKATQTYLNGGLIGMGPSLAALQMTLNRAIADEAAKAAEKTKGTSAGN